LNQLSDSGGIIVEHAKEAIPAATIFARAGTRGGGETRR
jgi:hypothetical protein